jgi:hypothetical protein
MIGPAAMLVLTLIIADRGNGWFTAADIAFLTMLAVTILARWLDFRGGHPQTAMGEPAKPAHLRRYVPAALLLGLAVWTAANLIGNY